MALFDVRSSSRIFDGVVASVRIDEVEFAGPDGPVWAKREVVEHDLAVVIAAVDDTGEEPRIVLIEQYRHPLGRRIWELPAGLMDLPGEIALATAQRELAEECALAAQRWEILAEVAASPGFTTEAARIFLARELSEQARPDPAEHEEADLRVVRVPVADAVRAVLAGEIVNAAACVGILAADHALRTGEPLRPGDEPWTDGPALEAAPRPDLSRSDRW